MRDMRSTAPWRAARRPWLSAFAGSTLLFTWACAPGESTPERERDRAGDAGVSRGSTAPSDAAHEAAPDAAQEAAPDGARTGQIEEDLKQADRSCEQDLDCGLLAINSGCLDFCDLAALSTEGLETARTILSEANESCPPGRDPGPIYQSHACSTQGFQAVCRDGHCEHAPAPCSEGCELDGDACVGPPGLTCQRCPLDADGHGQSCAVPGQICDFGPCSGFLHCIVDRENRQVWDTVYVDCL